jgi:hypothetical protein
MNRLAFIVLTLTVRFATQWMSAQTPQISFSGVLNLEFWLRA